MKTRLQVILVWLIALAVPTAEGHRKTEDLCYSKKEGCCSNIYLGVDNDFNICINLHVANMPKENVSIQKIRFFSNLVECVYKRRKYIGKGDTINMKMVKSDAEKLFSGHPNESSYYVEMFEFCRQDAKTAVSLIRQNPTGRTLLKESARPYFVLVFLCNSFYHKYHDCPYFRWSAHAGSEFEKECQRAREKCYMKEILTTSPQLQTATR